MSDDLVNQLTLNFLISKEQLQKLNKKTKDTAEQRKIQEIQEYSDRIKILFYNLLVYQPPEDLLFEVKIAFENFIDKSIYYLKAHDNCEHLEKERSEEIHKDIDFEKEERDIENGNYKECSNFEEESESEKEELEEDKNPFKEEIKPIIHQPIIVKSKYNKSTISEGVDELQKLPLDWFQNVRQDYKKNQIIPRKKETNITEPSLKNVKKKI